MSFNKLYLDKEKFIEMYKNDNLDYIFRVDSLIFEGNKSYKLYKLLKKGKLKKLKKLIKKYGK